MKRLYIVYVHITPEGMHYYGVTNNSKRRWEYNGIHYRDTSLNTYIEKYGWDNIQHIVLYENLTYEDALKIEDSLIISGWEKGNCINKRRSGNVSKDDVYIREYQREYQQEYYEKNKDKLIQYSREYREQNKDKFRKYQREYKRQYYEKNRDKINEQSRQRYHENLSKSREKNRIKNQKYRQRKKEEKQFRELGYVPLF